MIKFYALITHLYNEMGHRYAYHLALRKSIHQLGFPYIGFINKRCTIQNLPQDWIRCFHCKDKVSFFGKISQLVFRVRDFCTIFHKKKSAGEIRIFFLESFGKRDFLALVLSFFLAFKKSDYFLLFFGINLNNPPSKQYTYCWLLKIANFRLKNRLVFMTDSEDIVRFFDEKLFETCHILPIPLVEDIKFSYKRAANPIICWWPGFPREEKGQKEVIALSQLTEGSESFQLCLSELSKPFIVQKHLAICFLKAELTRQEYLDQLNCSDVILLPYDPSAYMGRTSGILVEAVSMGKIPLVKDGSWLAEEMKKFELSELIIDWNRKDLFCHIHSLIQESTIREKLKEMQNAYINIHSLRSYTMALKEILNSVADV